MRKAWAALAAAALMASGWGQGGPAASAVFQADFSNPGISPSQWTLTLHPDGSGHFHSVMKPDPAGVEQQHMVVPDQDENIQVSPAYAQHVFQVAERHHFFNQQCESHLNVAFQGWKTFSYSGPDGKGSCKFNYSKDREIQALENSLEAVVQTLLEGARLEMLLEHDRLGLDREMRYLTNAVKEGRAQQIGAIRSILERLANDPEVLDRVRKGATDLLARADR
ncbi:MAG: hypothetical protein ACLGRW_00950 [Acidobacteriota bacterium]